MPATTAPQIDNGVYNRMAGTWWDANGVLKRSGVFWYDPINRTTFGKLTMIKMDQEWKFTRLAPPTLHVWEMSITPADLKASLLASCFIFKHLIPTWNGLPYSTPTGAARLVHASPPPVETFSSRAVCVVLAAAPLCAHRLRARIAAGPHGGRAPARVQRGYRNCSSISCAHRLGALPGHDAGSCYQRPHRRTNR
jgi:hypothetical protein